MPSDPQPQSDFSGNSLESLVEQTANHFEQRWKQSPRWIAVAPGRVNVIGEHTDYNDGFVLPMAIERYVAIAAASLTASTTTARVHSTAADEMVELPLAEPFDRVSAGWSSYVQGVVAGFAARGHRLPSFAAEVHADLPLGGGLSSSAALEVAMATLCEALSGVELDPIDKALLCQQAEHDFAHVPCGIMDQFSSVFGRRNTLLLLDCRSRNIQHVPLDDAVALLIVNSNVRHALCDGEYARRREQCAAAAQKLGVGSLRDARLDDLSTTKVLTEVERRRARHVITEIDRTREAAEAIRGAQWQRVGQLMYASHESLRDDFEVSCAELDQLVEISLVLGSDEGVYGSRMTGGGFGGCTVSLVRTDCAARVAKEIETRYREQTGRQADTFATRPAAGAHIVTSS